MMDRKHLLGRQEARLQLRTRRLMVKPAANAHELSAPIPVLRVPHKPIWHLFGPHVTRDRARRVRLELLGPRLL